MEGTLTCLFNGSAGLRGRHVTHSEVPSSRQSMDVVCAYAYGFRSGRGPCCQAYVCGESHAKSGVLGFRGVGKSALSML